MTDHKKYNDQYFSRWAPVYDVFELLLSDVRKQIVKEIDPSGRSVLDVATGTGNLAIDLSHTAEKVVGIDLSADMLAVAEKKGRKANLSLLLMDASRMDFPDESFDIVTISLGLHDMPPAIRTLVLKEIRRVLKTDGKLYIVEYDLPDNPLIGAIASRLINTFESQYYLGFIQSDLDRELKSLGFTIGKKTRYLYHFLRLITLTK